MIQRIQSIYLLLGAVAFILLLFVDAVWESEAAAAWSWFAPVLLILGGLIVLTALGSIFLYKDRHRQRKVVIGLLFLTLAFTALLVVGLFTAGTFGLAGEGGIIWSRVLTLLLPLVGYVFFSLARRGIDRDIALVRSMDRLR